ncbi:MAG: methionyl-tRNA formyltransferase [Acidobacteria bacterium]|nr:methionyl-tRNA formyltransferase [Acidobacteriota bacterium]
MPALKRVVFFGSPEFAIPTLEALASTAYRPLVVVTQPTRPAGRGRHAQEPPVARWARQAGIETWQPEKVRAENFLERFETLEADVAVVVAFGQIFPQALLDLPRLGCVNLHASLLPAYRGAAPIQAAIAAGDKESGVTTMLMEAGLDTGPTLMQSATPVGAAETAPDLGARLASMGAELMVETLRGLAEGRLEAIPQPSAGVSVAPRLRKEDGRVRWSCSAGELSDRFRAFQPWPGLTTLCLGRDLKLIEVSALSRKAPAEASAGTFLGLHDGCLEVACGDSSVLGLRTVQRPGRRALDAVDFSNGNALTPGRQEFSSPPADAVTGDEGRTIRRVGRPDRG